jgi:CheY-like chemotaxis protein
LDFSKIESGKLTLMPTEYHVSSLINDIITLINTRIGEKPVIFTLNINDDLPAKLFGDDLRIKQIFNNLLSNAIKYTEAGNIELTVNVTGAGETANNVWMEITVRDTGIGISEENMEKLFVDYYRVENKAKHKMEGTGLGLSITRRLVEMMSGEITAESNLGSGSIFRTRILQGYVDNTIIGSEIAGNLRKFTYAEDNRLVSKKLVRSDMSFARVLVVDDMQTNLDVAAGLLGKYKMQIDSVLSGKEAVEKIRLGVPVYNAIFMDHMMPEMDGIETAIAIRNLATEYARKIPIIALTANAIHGTENLFFAHDFQAFLSKPIDIMQMDSIVRKWISPTSTHRIKKKD